MRRIFKCVKCGSLFVIEADHFIPGVCGTIVTNDGVVHKYEDPADDKECNLCFAEKLIIELEK